MLDQTSLPAASATAENYLYSCGEAAILWSDGKIDRWQLTEIEWGEMLTRLRQAKFQRLA
jgi:hypothetical protein